MTAKKRAIWVFGDYRNYFQNRVTLQLLSRAKELAAKTENMVGADIEFICRKAAMLAIREFIGNNRSETDDWQKCFKISSKHFDKAIAVVAAQNDDKNKTL